jgi:hypothetical protein
MRFLLPVVLTVAQITSGVARGEIVNHCRPDGSGGIICRLERVAPPPPPPLTPERIKSFQQIIRSQIPYVPYTMTPDEMTSMERYGGTASNEERAAQPGSQFMECETRLGRIGYSHVELETACSGLSIHAPTKEQQAAFEAKRDADLQAALDAQRRAGEALRDKIKADRERAAAQPHPAMPLLMSPEAMCPAREGVTTAERHLCHDMAAKAARWLTQHWNELSSEERARCASTSGRPPGPTVLALCVTNEEELHGAASADTDCRSLSAAMGADMCLGSDLRGIPRK